MGVVDEVREPAGLALAVGAVAASAATGLPLAVAAGVGAAVLVTKVATGVWLDGRSRSPAEAPAAPGAPPPSDQSAEPAEPAPEPPEPAVSQSPAGNVFRPEGEFWTIAYRGATFRLKDAKGLRHLHRLLAAPGHELHVIDLAGTLGERSDRSAGPPGEDGLSVAADDAGALLDPEAKAAYRRRLEDLDAEVDEARAWGDGERVARAEEEIAALAAELARAVGLHGADRKAVSATERARVNVTRAVKAAIERIAEHDRALGHHLSSTVRTGTFCSYRPDPDDAPRWQL